MFTLITKMAFAQFISVECMMEEFFFALCLNSYYTYLLCHISHSNNFLFQMIYVQCSIKSWRNAWKYIQSIYDFGDVLVQHYNLYSNQIKECSHR